MKNKMMFLGGIFVTVIIAAVLIGNLSNNREKEQKTTDTIQIVTSFYPTYILVQNAVKGMDGVNVTCLVEATTGCLHDYQLTTKDMKAIADADIFVQNGAGMENYIGEVVKEYPNLEIIDLSQNISFIRNEEDHEHEEEHFEEHKEEEQVDTDDIDHVDEIVEDAEHTDEIDEELTDDDGHEEEHDHDHGEYNAHVFTNPKLYMVQLDNFYQSFSQYLRENKADNDMLVQLANNVSAYNEKLTTLNEKIDALAEQTTGERAIIFHDAFVYLADRLGIEVISIVDMESEAGLSAGEIAAVIKKVKSENVKFLLIEKQYENTIADRIENETDAKVYVIDSCVTGDNSLDSYLNSMQYNLDVLDQAFLEQ